MRAEGKKTPNISIFIGNPVPGQDSAVSNSLLTRKANQVDQWFLNNPAHPELKRLWSNTTESLYSVVMQERPTPWANETPPHGATAALQSGL